MRQAIFQMAYFLIGMGIDLAIEPRTKAKKTENKAEKKAESED